MTATLPAAGGEGGTAERPLAGRRILVPRAEAQAPALSARIEVLGGQPVEAPVLVIEPGDDGELRAAVRDLADGRFVAICLTSPNGVDALTDAIDDEGLDARVLAAAGLVACVGRGTARRLHERLAVRADLLPPAATTESLGAALPAGTGRVLLPRADLANPVLGELLAAKGYEPVDVVAYRTTAPDALAPPVLDDLEAGRIDLVALASPSTARNLVRLLGDRDLRAKVVSIGPVTSAECREHDLEVVAEADPHDLDGLVAALVHAATS